MKDTNKVIKSVISKNRSSNCLVAIDGEILELSLDLVMKHKLSNGVIISEKLLNQILKEQRKLDIQQSAIAFVSYKPRTVKQITDKLRLKGYKKEEIQYAVNFLKEYNYLDDRRYAHSFVKDYLVRKSVSDTKLLAELKKRGVPDDLAKEAVLELYPANDEFELAQKAAEKKLRMLSGKSIEKQKSSLISYLQRQGFKWEIIKKVLESEINISVEETFV